MKSIRDLNISFGDSIPTAMVLDDRTRYLFLGSEKGSIYSMKLSTSNSVIDLNTTYHLLQSNVHQGAITKVEKSFSVKSIHVYSSQRKSLEEFLARDFI